MVEYDPQKIETKWQEKWEEDKVFQVKEDPAKPKFFVLEMYPYPSSALHMGHLRNYSIGDTFARYKRMQAFNVLYPMGYDSFGLPAENAAIDHGIDPETWTDNNIATIKGQQQRIGLSYDWSRQIWSHNTDYYKWDQWFFLKFYEMGLAYREKAYVNWCPQCNTVLANEQVQGGRCWRCSSEVDQKFLTQWNLKIRAYAEELLEGLNDLNWPENVKQMQRNWIGKSEGSIIKFPIEGEERTIDIFTTRPDTIFGVTFMTFAVENPWVRDWVKGTKYEEEFENIYATTMKLNRFQRTDVNIEKLGMFIGKYAINPLTQEKVPIYIGNFVIYEYGAGAVMAVPAHDQRDFEFAKKYNIPIKVVIQPFDYELNAETMSRSYEADGTLVNSGEFNGMENRTAIKTITEKLNQMGMGNATINYKIRDWLISRQRYWGCPIPIIYCDDCGTVPVPYDQLPVVLPKDVSFTGKGNPLETSEAFLNVNCPKCGKKAKRETDTMDTFIDSSWYFFKYTDPKTKDLPYRKKIVNYWGNVDQYIGGIEHAVMHLLYARFWTKVSRDLKLHKFNEPFQALLTQGMINKAHPFCPKCNTFARRAEKDDEKCKRCGTKYEPRSVKMSKNLGNTVDPNEIVKTYGADSARFFILFGASPESALEWSEEGLGFAFKFMKNVFSLVSEPPVTIRKEKSVVDSLIIYILNKTIKEVTASLEKMAIRDAVNHMIQLTTELNKYMAEGVIEEVFNECKEKLILLLHPVVPHMTEELWELMGKKGYISLAKWPSFDENLLTPSIEFKWNLMIDTLDSINQIRLITKKDSFEKIQIIVADEWKFKFYSKLMELLEKTKNQGEITKKIMQDKELKPRGQFISQTIGKVLKNVGKYPKISLSNSEEIEFFKDIKLIIERKYNCTVTVDAEKDSKEEKAIQALPGRPAIVVL